MRVTVHCVRYSIEDTVAVIEVNGVNGEIIEFVSPSTKRNNSTAMSF